MEIKYTFVRFGILQIHNLFRTKTSEFQMTKLKLSVLCLVSLLCCASLSAAESDVIASVEYFYVQLCRKSGNQSFCPMASRLLPGMGDNVRKIAHNLRKVT